MSFQTKLALATALAVALSVWCVALALTTIITRSFEDRDSRQTQALAVQLRRELKDRGTELTRRVEAVAASGEIARVAAALGETQPDTAQFVDTAASLAREQSLDFLEIAASDGTVVSSAQWAARFGYKDEWLTQNGSWQSTPVFLKREDLHGGVALGFFVVRIAETPSGPVYIAGGQKLDQGFADSIAGGVPVELWDGDSKPRPSTAGIVDEVRKSPVDTTRIVNEGRFTASAIPLTGRDGKLLAMIVALYSRSDLMSLIAYTRYTAAGVGICGVLLGVALSWWIASRVARPVRSLAGSVREVADGNWGVRAEVESNDEVGRLAADFNHMTAQLVEQKQRMVQAERVAAWRELARRLAHELKNPLFPLQLTVENLQRARTVPAAEYEEIFRESTATLLAELRNLNIIIGRFSDFAKMPAPQFESVDVNELAAEVIRFHQAQFGGKITPRLDLDPSSPRVWADPEQLRRALRNLVLNAMDAMQEGGDLVIRTTAQERSTIVEVSDTGAGLTQEECDRLFTPYYTTKQHGTGLGLAIVQSVVSDHHGSITVHSEPGGGATFRIELATPLASGGAL